MLEDDETGPKNTGGADIILSLMDRGSKKAGAVATERRVLEYNNREPESTLEQFILPKERVVKKVENPESDDMEL